MPADSASAAPGASGATQTQTQPAVETAPSRVNAILEAEGLSPVKQEPNDHATQDKQQKGSSDQSTDGDRARRSEAGDRGTDNVREEGDQGGAQNGGEEGESESDAGTHSANGAERPADDDGGDDDERQVTERDPFKDERVQDRLSREARKRERLMRAAGLSDEEIAAVKGSKDQTAAAEAAIAAKLKTAIPASTGPKAPQGKGLLGGITTEDDLEKWETAAQQSIDWIDAHPDGVRAQDPATGEERFYAPEELEKLRRDHEKVLLQAPKRRDEIRAAMQRHHALAQQVQSIVEQHYPALFHPDTPEHEELVAFSKNDELGNAFVRDHPELQSDPRFALFIARYYAGAKAEKRTNGKAPSGELQPFLKPRAKVAPSVPGVRGNGNGNGKTVSIEKARERVQTDGGEEAETDLIGALRGRTAGAGAALV